MGNLLFLYLHFSGFSSSSPSSSASPGQMSMGDWRLPSVAMGKPSLCQFAGPAFFYRKGN